MKCIENKNKIHDSPEIRVQILCLKLQYFVGPRKIRFFFLNSIRSMEQINSLFIISTPSHALKENLTIFNIILNIEPMVIKKINKYMCVVFKKHAIFLKYIFLSQIDICNTLRHGNLWTRHKLNSK